MSWTSTRIEHLARTVNDSIDPATLGDNLVDHYSIPALDASGGPAVEPASDIQSNKQPLQGGEILISKLNPRKARVVRVPRVSDRRMLCSGEFVVLRPMGCEPRFLEYLLLAESTRQELDASVNSVTRSHQRVRPEVLTKLDVRVPPPEEQRVIADYLDTETARIDALITKKRHLITLLEERRRGRIEASIRALARSVGTQPLKYAAPGISVGIVITPAAYYVDDGVPAVRGVNVREGFLDTSELIHLSVEGDAINRKSRLREGDVVVVRTGQAGAACVVPSEVDGWNCIDLLIVRRTSALEPKFLEFVLNSDWTRKHIDAHSVGTIQSHFNVGSLKEVPVPVPAIEVQQSVWHELEASDQSIGHTSALLRRQVQLLSEHRTALIARATTKGLPTAKGD